jgi:hypothetical protein
MVAKIDLKKQYRELYSASPKRVVLVDVPEQKILSISGKGDPNTSPAFQQGVEALFPVAFKTKFLSKKELGRDYVVMPLEGLWWAEDMAKFTTADRDNWQWKIFIVQPDFITSDFIEAARAEVKQKKNPPALDKLCFETLHEGPSVQILHVGPYAEEGSTIERLHGFAREQNCSFDGLVQKHHEIYLSDMRRTAPEKLRTILRQPVVRK